VFLNSVEQAASNNKSVGEGQKRDLWRLNDILKHAGLPRSRVDNVFKTCTKAHGTHGTVGLVQKWPVREPAHEYGARDACRHGGICVEMAFSANPWTEGKHLEVQGMAGRVGITCSA
jgi:hypothetical protein